MSSLIRFAALGALRRCSALKSTTRLISTSKNKRETAVPACETTEAAVKTEKNWISYGFDIESKEEDRHWMHVLTFVGVSVVFVWGGVALAYKPDHAGLDWANREAFLELRRREQLGLPLVDPNYLPLDQIVIPSDEELGDTEIVI